MINSNSKPFDKLVIVWIFFVCIPQAARYLNYGVYSKYTQYQFEVVQGQLIIASIAILILYELQLRWYNEEESTGNAP